MLRRTVGSVRPGHGPASLSTVVTPLFRYTSNQMIQFNHDKCRGYSQRESVRGSLFPDLFNVGNSLVVCYSTRLTCAPLFINTPTEVELTSLFTRFHMQESQKVLSLGCLVSQEIKEILTFLVNSAL